jgi:hypothetical protein
MKVNTKYIKAKAIIDSITHLERDRRNILQALDSPVLSCTIDYGSGGCVPIYNIDSISNILKVQLELVEEELIKYYNELEKL